jgi:twitching motility protein PilJ
MKKRSGKDLGGALISNKLVIAPTLGFLISISLALLVFIHVSNWESYEEEYLLRATELRVASERIAKFGLAAAGGDETAFLMLERSEKSFGNHLHKLRNGVELKGVPPVPTSLGNEMTALVNAWQDKLLLSANDIVNNREAVLSVREYVQAISDTVPQLQEVSEELVDILAQAGADRNQLTAASQQLMLAQRIDKNVSRVLEGGQVTAGAIDQFSRDADRFGRVLEGMRKGSSKLNINRITNAAAVGKLKQVEELFKVINGHAEQIIETTPRLLPALEAASNINAVSDEVAGAAFQLISGLEKSPGRFNFFGFLAGPAMVAFFVVLAGVFFAIRSYLVLLDARRNEEELKRQNERNQRAILTLLDEMGDLADGDLTVTATVTEDVTGAIADSINYAVEALRSLVIAINETSDKVSTSAQESRATAMHLAEASEHQADQITATTQAMKAMAQAMDDMSSDANESVDIAKQSVEIAGKGGDTVRRTILGMDTIREQIQETSKRIKRLGESSQEIGDIVEIIEDIADQTNILALNAAMQAAMAGEAGRGFAVVADEVQRLAERSSNATKQIEALVKTIQADTNEAVASMEGTTAEVVSGAKLAEDAGEALMEIENVSNHIAGVINKIASSAQTQSSEASKIDDTMSVIQEITTQTLDGTNQAASSIGNLAELADELQQSVAGFRLPE